MKAVTEYVFCKLHKAGPTIQTSDAHENDILCLFGKCLE